MLITEENLLEQLNRKNEDALYYVIDVYGGLIKSIVGKHLYNLPSMQEECVDDILIAIWDHIAAFSPEKNSLKNWIAAIAKYKSIDYKRRYLKWRDQQSIEELVVVSSRSTDQAVLKKELEQEVESLLSHLNADDRSIFVQYYLEDRDVEAIAGKMQVSKSNIYNRLSRGRNRLRKIYGSR